MNFVTYTELSTNYSPPNCVYNYGNYIYPILYLVLIFNCDPAFYGCCCVYSPALLFWFE